jgi:CBS domain-containing protein
MSEPRTIRDYMVVDLVTLPPTMEIVRAMSILLDRGFSGAPVVDEAGHLVGVLSRKDCFKAALNASYHQEWGGVVADYMSREVETLDADMEIVQAAQFFLQSPYRRFPVLHGGQLAGQISRCDLLRALSELWR